MSKITASWGVVCQIETRRAAAHVDVLSDAMPAAFKIDYNKGVHLTLRGQTGKVVRKNNV